MILLLYAIILFILHTKIIVNYYNIIVTEDQESECVITTFVDMLNPEGNYNRDFKLSNIVYRIIKLCIIDVAFQTSS